MLEAELFYKLSDWKLQVRIHVSDVRLSRANLYPSIDNALAKAIAATLQHLKNPPRDKQCGRVVTPSIRLVRNRVLRPATRNSISVQRRKSEALRIVGVKTKCFTDINASRSRTFRPDEELRFLAAPQSRPAGA